MHQAVRILFVSLCACCWLSAVQLVTAQQADEADRVKFKIEVKAGAHDRVHTPVKLIIDLPKAEAKKTFAIMTETSGQINVGQLTAPSLLADTDAGDKETVARELHFILPSLKAGETATYTVEVGGRVLDPPGSSPTGFTWQDTAGQYSELHYDSKPVLRYMYRAFDDSTPENRFLTYKVFHHLFDQAGERIVTNGPDGHSSYVFKEVQFPHHRGIFYGFNKCLYGENLKSDLWHCQGDDYQAHAGVLASETGPLLGRHCIAVAWHGKEKKVILNEQREITVYHLPTGRLIEFASVLKSEVGNLTLDGDPQHAGFQFRAHNEVAAKTAKQTYYIRVDGTGKPGETKNWPGDKTQVDFPWKGMSYVLGDKRYTAAYIDKPTNPKEARFSERDYARFGSYFTTQVKPDAPLAVNYRLWFQDGEMTGEQIEAISTDFVEPPQAAVIE